MKNKVQKTRPALRTWLRRGLILLLSASAVCLLAARHEQRTQDHPDISVPVPSAAPDERSLRERAYQQDLEALEKLLQSGAADENTQLQAAQRMQRMIDEHQSEIAIEESLEKSGFDPSLVLLQNGALTVILNEKQVQADVSASILNLCTAHTDILAENIRIMTSQP